MQYPDDKEIAPSTMPPLQGSMAVKYKATLDNFLSFVHNRQYTQHKEREDAPWQVVLGSIDTSFCMLISLASWMELNHRENPNAVPYAQSNQFC